MKSQTQKIITSFGKEIRFPVSTRLGVPAKKHADLCETIVVSQVPVYSRQYPGEYYRIQYSALND